MSKTVMTAHQKERAREMRADFAPSYIARVIGVSVGAVKSLYVSDSETGFAQLYNAGRLAHHHGQTLAGCPYSDSVNVGDATIWKAGWHDADIEAGNRWREGRVA